MFEIEREEERKGDRENVHEGEIEKQREIERWTDGGTTITEK